jgi:hypothetical protein
MKPSNHRVGHRAGNLASGTTTHLQMVESSKDKDGGRYRIRTYDFHRVNSTTNGNCWFYRRSGTAKVTKITARILIHRESNREFLAELLSR